MKFSIKGVVIGGVADVVLSGLLGIPFTIYVIANMGLSSQPKDQLSAAVIGAIHNSPGLYAIQLFIGLVSSVIGGYIAARIAKRDEFMNGVLASWLCVGIGVYSLVTGKDSQPLPVHLGLIAITPLCYVLGAFFWKKTSRVNVT